MKAKITILLSTYNRAHLILETLKSIKKQTHTNFECYITDDNSTDGTQQVVEDFCKLDSRFTYHLKPSSYPKGLSANRNFGLDLAQENNAQFIQFFDDDDIMHPKKLEKQLRVMQEQKLDLVLCKSQNYSNDFSLSKLKLDIQEVDNLADNYLKGLMHFGAPTPLFKFSYINKLRFNELLFYSEEWVLFCQLFYKYPPKVKKINDVLFYRRKHPQSITENFDVDFSKRKTNAITGIILFDYLTQNKLHSRQSLVFFFKRFVFQQYDKRRALNIVQLSKSISTFFYLKTLFFFNVKFYVYRISMYILNK